MKKLSFKDAGVLYLGMEKKSKLYKSGLGVYFWGGGSLTFGTLQHKKLQNL